ncbi:MAG: hypothetical protein ACPHY8_02815 [Patescibacteria group bacterium]
MFTDINGTTTPVGIFSNSIVMFACIPENNFNFHGLLSEIFVLNFDIPLS